MKRKTKNIYKFDSVGNRFEFFYNKEKDEYFVEDKLLKTNTILEIKTRKYKSFKEVDELKQIRYWYPKPHNLKQKYITKVFQ